MVAAYIDRCVKSVLLQEYPNLEIVLVNDGSKDGSLSICNTYAQNDARVRVFSQEHGGVSSARNCGLDQARGEFIAFLDADDWMEPEMLEVLYHLAIKNNSKIAMCNYFQCREDNREINRLSETIPPKGTVVYPETFAYIFNPHSFDGYVWNKLYHRSFFDGPDAIRFGPEYLVCEDRLFVARLLQRASSITFTATAYYNYCIRTGSAIRGLKQNPALGLDARKMTIQTIPAEHASYDRAAYINLLVQAACLACERSSAPEFHEMHTEFKRTSRQYVKDFTRYKHEFPKRTRILMTAVRVNFLITCKIWALIRNRLKNNVD